MRTGTGRPAAWLACLAACVVSAGCGHSTSTQATSVTSTRPSPSAGLTGNGSLSQAGTICQGFVDHLDRVLARGIGAVAPEVAPELVGELEGLSRRIEFLSAPAGERAAAARWAADLDRAATVANGLARMSVASSAARQRYAAALDNEGVALERANADALRLGLRRCRITVNGATVQRSP